MSEKGKKGAVLFEGMLHCCADWTGHLVPGSFDLTQLLEAAQAGVGALRALRIGVDLSTDAAVRELSQVLHYMR